MARLEQVIVTRKQSYACREGHMELYWRRFLALLVKVKQVANIYNSSSLSSKKGLRQGFLASKELLGLNCSTSSKSRVTDGLRQGFLTSKELLGQNSSTTSPSSRLIVTDGLRQGFLTSKELRGLKWSLSEDSPSSSAISFNISRSDFSSTEGLRQGFLASMELRRPVSAHCLLPLADGGMGQRGGLLVTSPPKQTMALAKSSSSAAESRVAGGMDVDDARGRWHATGTVASALSLDFVGMAFSHRLFGLGWIFLGEGLLLRDSSESEFTGLLALSSTNTTAVSAKANRGRRLRISYIFWVWHIMVYIFVKTRRLER